MEGTRDWQGQVARGQADSACQTADARREDPKDQGKSHRHVHCLPHFLTFCKLLVIALTELGVLLSILFITLSLQFHMYDAAMLAAVMPGTKLQEHTGSDKAWVWSTMDFASEQQRMELFCLKLPSPASKTKHPALTVCMPL